MAMTTQMTLSIRTRSLRRRFAIDLLCLSLLVLAAGQARGQGPNSQYWLLSTRACPQVLGADPAPFLQASRLDLRGRLSRREPAELLVMATNRPVIFLVHGSYYTADMAVSEGLRVRSDLAAVGALPPDAVVVAFDWPSQLVYPNLIRDANDKARRAFVAGHHLARFLHGFPPGSRVSLIGHSHGGVAVLSALHLLGGGMLDDGADATVLPADIPPLRLRAVVIASASDRQWLDPGERYDRALAASEGILCLYNRLDPALVLHPLGRYSDHRRALGKAGMGRVEGERLGPLATRYRERNIGPLLGVRHTFRGATAIPTIARWIGPYAWHECPA